MPKSLCIVVPQCFKKDLIQLEVYIKLLPRVHFRKHVSHNQSKSVVFIVLLHGTFCLSSSSLSNLFSRASSVFLFLLRDEVHGNWKGCCGLSLGEGVCREGKDGVGDGGICNVTGNWEVVMALVRSSSSWGCCLWCSRTVSWRWWRRWRCSMWLCGHGDACSLCLICFGVRVIFLLKNAICKK